MSQPVATDVGRDAQPYEPGNTAAVKHGATSARTVQPVADELVADLATAASWTTMPAFAGAVASWAYAEAQAVLLRSWLDEHGFLDDDGAPRPAAVYLERIEARAHRAREALGLTPLSWSRLVERLGSADGEAAARGLEHLKAIGRELAQGVTAVEGDGRE